MADSDDDDYACYGTPLEPIEEDSVPRKKPIPIEEQEVTDKHGRRRFHGAFTGGFSAGFYNTVGSLEGWKPSTFKSTRGERNKVKVQLPEDFMDDEDTDEFGIAPSVLKAKPEYNTDSKKRTYDQVSFFTGPIPGEPVLRSILQPAKETVGVMLLMKMGWKPGQGIGPRLTKLQKKLKRRKNKEVKVYTCLLRSESSSSSDEEWDPDTLFAPEDVEVPVVKPKEDSAGLGYQGLAHELAEPTICRPFTMVDQNNKRLAIAGQAFGVGAFEEEDDDIYCNDDKSKYDFTLESLDTKKQPKGKNRLAITDGSTGFLGFVLSSLVEKKKYFAAPQLPAGYVAAHRVKKSRFDVVDCPREGVQGNVRLDADSRATALDPEIRIKKEPVQDDKEDIETPSADWKPFSSDPAKQERYDKFLHLVKIGAKDAFSKVQPFTMTDWERERELTEFESAARLYTPLGGFLGDRFTHGGGVKVEQAASEKAEAAISKQFGRLTRTVEDWQPHSLVCKRFNIQPPQSEIEEDSLKKAADKKRKRPKFGVFDFLEASKSSSLSSLVESSIVKQEPIDERMDEEQAAEERSEGEAKLSRESRPSDQEPETISSDTPSKINKQESKFEDPPDKMDLFKAIFESSEESETEAEESSSAAVREVEVVNVLRNTSPPRGIFANLDLDEMNRTAQEASVNLTEALRKTSPPRGVFSNPDEANRDQEVCKTDTAGKTSPQKVIQPAGSAEPTLEDLYGPQLPSTPVFNKPKTYCNVNLEVDDGLWIEKTKQETKTTKSHKKHKKHKSHSKKKKEKHKKKKKSKHSDSD